MVKMVHKYGLRVSGVLVAKYDTPHEAYEKAVYAYNETGEFHEVVLVF